MNQDLLALAKQRLSLSALMVQLGFGDHAKKSARCPFHEDSSASFSVYLGDDGQERWKCHAGCGQGDAIDFLAKHHGMSNADACREYIRLAGVTLPPAPPSSFNSPPSVQPPFDWQSCVAAFTADYRAKLSTWRRYSPKFVEWLHTHNLIGLFQGGRFAFPVHDTQGNVTGCHYRLKEDGSWRYHPSGTRTALFIIGDIKRAKTIFVFESPWDLLAVLDAFHWHIQPMTDTAFIATRGATNARLLAGLCAPDAVVRAFGQNDSAGQKWLAAVAAHCGCKCVRVVTPPPHKDLNDWTRAGATRPEIEAAIAAAQPVTVSNAPGLHATPPKNVSTRIALTEEADEPESAPFPLDALPPAMAGIVAAVARCERVPVALPSICALGVVCAAIGAGLEIVSAADRVTRANLFLLGSAESGSGKSQVFRRIADPILEHQKALHENYRDKTAPQLASELAVLTREIANLEKKAAKSTDDAGRQRMLGELEYRNARLAQLKLKNAPPCVICGDVTSEKLAVMLAGNRETLCSASSEARQIVDIVCGRYNATKSTDEEIYLCGFSGDAKRVDRLGRDPVTLHKPCLSVLWLVQPDALSRLFETESLMHSGFLARFLVCPTLAAPQKIVEGQTHAISDSVRLQWAGLIAGLLATYHAAEKPFRIEPSPEAKRLLDDFFNSVVDRRTGELSDVGQFASRYGEQAWRVALTLHAALYGREAHNHPLEAQTASNAVRIVEWFAALQLDILAKGRHAAAAELEDAVLELAANNRERKGLDSITARDIHRARITATPDAAKALLARMEADGLLTGEEITPPRGGKSMRIYRAVTNPIPG